MDHDAYQVIIALDIFKYIELVCNDIYILFKDHL